MLKLTSSAALAAAMLLYAAVPSIAHQGVLHEGCPAGQVFTSGDIAVSAAFTRATLPGAPTAGGYLTISNSGTSPDRLLGASSEAAPSVQVHEMRMEGSIMKMSAVPDGLEIPPGGTVTLAPGGYHLMMMGLGQTLAEGACVEVTLKFAKAGELPVQLSVGSMAASAPPDGSAAPAGGTEHMHH